MQLLAFAFVLAAQVILAEADLMYYFNWGYWTGTGTGTGTTATTGSRTAGAGNTAKKTPVWITLQKCIWQKAEGGPERDTCVARGRFSIDIHGTMWICDAEGKPHKMKEAQFTTEKRKETRVGYDYENQCFYTDETQTTPLAEVKQCKFFAGTKEICLPPSSHYDHFDGNTYKCPADTKQTNPTLYAHKNKPDASTLGKELGEAQTGCHSSAPKQTPAPAAKTVQNAENQN